MAQEDAAVMAREASLGHGAVTQAKTALVSLNDALEQRMVQLGDAVDRLMESRERVMGTDAGEPESAPGSEPPASDIERLWQAVGRFDASLARLEYEIRQLEQL